MTPETSLSRRALLGSVAGGMVLGGVWGAAFPALAMENRATLAVVGHRGAQIAVVDSTEARALILVGDPDGTLMERLPAVMTVFRQRIDLLIASQPVLLRHAGHLRDRWRIRHALSLQPGEDHGAPSTPTTPVTDGVRIDLGAGMSLDALIGHRGDWDARNATTGADLWTIRIEHTGGVVVVAPNASSLESVSPGSATLLMIPDMPPPDIANRTPTMALACNDDSQALETIELPEKPLTRIFPQDIARFVLHDDGIDLPPWAHDP